MTGDTAAEWEQRYRDTLRHSRRWERRAKDKDARILELEAEIAALTIGPEGLSPQIIANRALRRELDAANREVDRLTDTLSAYIRRPRRKANHHTETETR